MNYLKAFSLSNLALLSDWIEETGELYVDVYVSHSGAGGTSFFIRSLQDLKSIVSQFRQLPQQEIVVTIFRQLQFSLRGVANEELLEQALQQIPNHHPYEIVYLRYYPAHCNFCGSGTSHADLRKELTEVFGELVGIGPEPDVGSDKLRSNVADVFEVSISLKEQFQVFKNQEFYARYENEPHRYQWIESLWSE